MRPGPGLVVMALAFISGARRGSTSTGTSSKNLLTSLSTSSTASSSPFLLTQTPTPIPTTTSKSKSTDNTPINFPFIGTFVPIASTYDIEATSNNIGSGIGEDYNSGGGGIIRKTRTRRRRKRRKTRKLKEGSSLSSSDLNSQYQDEPLRRDIFKLFQFVLPSHFQKPPQQQQHPPPPSHQKVTSSKRKSSYYSPLIDNKSTIRKKRGSDQDSSSATDNTSSRESGANRSFSSASLSSSSSSSSAAVAASSSSSSSSSSASSSTSSLSSSNSADEIDISVGSGISSLAKQNTHNYRRGVKEDESADEEEAVEQIEDSVEGLIVHFPTQQSTDSSISFDEDEDILALVAEDDLISQESFGRLTELTGNSKINYINEGVANDDNNNDDDEDYSEQLDSLNNRRSSVSSKSRSSSSQDSEIVVNRRRKSHSIPKVAVKLPNNNIVDGPATTTTTTTKTTSANAHEPNNAYVSKLVGHKSNLVSLADNDNSASVGSLLSLVEETKTKFADKSLSVKVPQRSIIESASPLTRLNPWISACDLAQPGTAPDLQGQCSASTLPVAWVDEGPGPPTCPDSCAAQKLRKTRSTANKNYNHYTHNINDNYNNNNNNNNNNKFPNIKLKTNHNNHKNNENEYENIHQLSESIKLRRNVANDDTKVASKPSTMKVTAATTTKTTTTTSTTSTPLPTTTTKTATTLPTLTLDTMTTKTTTTTTTTTEEARTSTKITTTTATKGKARANEMDRELSDTTQEVEVKEMVATTETEAESEAETRIELETAIESPSETTIEQLNFVPTTNANNNNKNNNNNNVNNNQMNYEHLQPKNVANATAILALNEMHNNNNNQKKDVVNNNMNHEKQQQQHPHQEQEQKHQQEQEQPLYNKVKSNVGELKYNYLLRPDEHNINENINNNNNNKNSKQQLQKTKLSSSSSSSSSIANKLAIQKFLVKESYENGEEQKSRKKYKDQSRSNIMKIASKTVVGEGNVHDDINDDDDDYDHDDDDKQQCLDYLGDSEETSPLHLCSLKSPGQLVSRLRELRLRHCCERNVFSTLHTIALNATLSGGVDCVRILMDIIDLDALATRITCEYAEILFRFDCGQVYSRKHQCHDCKEAYRRWVCSTLVPYFAEPSDVIMPIFSHTNSSNNNTSNIQKNSNRTTITTTSHDKLHKNTNENIIKEITIEENKQRNKRETDSCKTTTLKGTFHDVLVYYAVNTSSAQHQQSVAQGGDKLQRQEQQTLSQSNKSTSTANIMDPCTTHEDPVILKKTKRSKRRVQFRRRKRIRPCLKVCQTVEQMCPYLLPADRAPAMPTQYAGEPTFLCLDLNIPEVEEQNMRSINGDKDCCYTYCGSGVESGICTQCPSFAQSVQNPLSSIEVTNATRRLHNITLTPNNDMAQDNGKFTLANNGNARSARISIALNNDSESVAVSTQRIMESLPYYAYYDGIFYYDDDMRDMPLQALSGDCDAVPSVTSRCTVPYYVSSAHVQHTKTNNHLLLWVSMLLCFFSSYQAAIQRSLTCHRVASYESRTKRSTGGLSGELAREIDYKIMPNIDKNTIRRKHRNTTVTTIIIWFDNNNNNYYYNNINKHNCFYYSYYYFCYYYNGNFFFLNTSIKTTKAVLSLIIIINYDVRKQPPPILSPSSTTCLSMDRLIEVSQLIKLQQETYELLSIYHTCGYGEHEANVIRRISCHKSKKRKVKKKDNMMNSNFSRTNIVNVLGECEDRVYTIIITTITILILTSTYLIYNKNFNKRINYKQNNTSTITKITTTTIQQIVNIVNSNNNSKQIFQLFYYYNFNINDWWRRWWIRKSVVTL